MPCFFSIDLDVFNKHPEINTPKYKFLKCFVSSILILMFWGLLQNLFKLQTSSLFLCMCLSVCVCVCLPVCLSVCV